MDNPFLLLLVGVALVMESVATPGFQIVSAMAGGGLIGWNGSRIIRKDY